jgi:hypothetical protein
VEVSHPLSPALMSAQITTPDEAVTSSAPSTSSRVRGAGARWYGTIRAMAATITSPIGTLM